MEKRYGVNIEIYQGPSLARQAALHGDELWKREPDKCCEIRKVKPLEEALSGVDAWMTGLRRDQSPSRADTPKLQWDEKNERWKASPLADWTEKDVWRYLAENDVPYNDLHDRGYASIGCTHCTKPGSGREGRWAESGKAECGLHR
jgi:phosphoadenosine phosphosulfate reductase